MLTAKAPSDTLHSPKNGFTGQRIAILHLLILQRLEMHRKKKSKEKMTVYYMLLLHPQNRLLLLLDGKHRHGGLLKIAGMNY